MIYSALIKLVRLVDVETLRNINDGHVPADRYCQRGGLRLLRPEGVPVVINHDLSRVAGVVHGILEFDDTDGPWAWARATITAAPEWLRQGTRCSYGSFPVHRGHHGWTHKSLISEVSLLSSTHTPVEPRACVTLLREKASEPEGEVIWGGGILRRPNCGTIVGVR